MTDRCARGKGHIFTCALCGYPAAFRREMVTHYWRHQIVFKQQRLKFPTMDEFLAWKEAFEQAEGSKFVKPRADNKLKNCRKIYYACQTNGVYQAKTRITVGFCPARMTASVDDLNGEVEVDFHETHVGHSVSTAATSKTSRSLKNRQIKVEDMFDSLPGDNIDVDDDPLASDDNSAASDSQFWRDIESSMREMKSNGSNIVRFYKARGSAHKSKPDLPLSRFITILASDPQLAALRRYGHRCVCIDVCCSVSEPLQLTLLMTISNDDRALPVAFMISNVTDQAALALFGSVIKKEAGVDIPAAVFIGDTTNAAYKGWCSAMAVPKIRLFSSWCVKREWKQKLSSLIVKAKHANTIYTDLCGQFTKRVERNFNVQFEELLTKLSVDENTRDFADYLRHRFAGTAKTWAPCYRQRYGLPFTVDGLLQNVVATLGVKFFGGKRPKNFANTIDAVMAQTRDLFSQKWAQSYDKDSENSLKAIVTQHLSLNDLTDVYVHSISNGWTVGSTAKPEEVFRVTPADSDCDCLLRCEECDNVCVHAFRCTCPDSSVRNSFCEHMHLVCTIFGGDDASSVGEGEQIIEPAEDFEFNENGAVVEVNTSCDQMETQHYVPVAPAEQSSQPVEVSESLMAVDESIIESVEFSTESAVEIETTPHEEHIAPAPVERGEKSSRVRKSGRTPRKSKRYEY